MQTKSRRTRTIVPLALVLLLIAGIAWHDAVPDRVRADASMAVDDAQPTAPPVFISNVRGTITVYFPTTTPSALACPAPVPPPAPAAIPNAAATPALVLLVDPASVCLRLLDTGP